MTIWQTLGVPRDSDRDAIRRAYARKLKVTNPEDDAEAFKRLRAAYEAALRHLEFAAQWQGFEEEEPEPEEVAESVFSSTVVTDPAEGPPGPGSDPPRPIEIDPILAERERELEALRAAMGELETGLRGPWRPDDAEIDRRLAQILRAPALGVIRIRTEVEAWLADLLAATIPRSDAVLLQSIQAFGWNNDSHRRVQDRGIAVVLDRLEEWRLIESLNRANHIHHAAWRSLTQPPAPWWRWRLNAFRPGMVTGIETLLGLRGGVASGLHYSYKPAAVERWQKFLARPRLTLGILALMPVALLGLLGLVSVAGGEDAAGSPLAIGIASAIAFAMPFVALFGLSRWRLRWQARYWRPRWASEGWLGAYALLAIGAMALPAPGWPMLVALPAIGIAIWAYIVAPPAQPGALGLGLGVMGCGFATIMSLTVVEGLDPAQSFALAVMAALLVYLRLTLWQPVRTTIDGLLGYYREWYILGGMVLGVAMVTGMVALATMWRPVLPIYPFGMAAMAMLPLVGAPTRGATGPHRVIARSLLILSFFWALGDSVPPAPPALVTTTNAPNAAQTDAALNDLDAGMMRLERRQPEFARLREGNPAIYAEVRAAITPYFAHRATLTQANAKIGDLVAAAYHRMAPSADSALLIEGLRIRLDRQKALRDSAPAACADQNLPVDDDKLPGDLRERQTEQTFAVISSPPAAPTEVAAGRPIPAKTLLNRAASELGTDFAGVTARLDGKHGIPPKCTARIALTQALLDNRLDDIAATLRDQLRRPTNPKAKP